ncbi:DUF2235 domain-containing protein [uncultured Sulfitobacter sp.]|uniref:DUF2235 domain-containing protein n=1 Tax=uncultured Sulfitobacter sp. TaxID=191468 RepID=UPI002627D195|nr:DUF2235 domain-containing protein [uncultured Sulfitobacter sp.]
MFGRLWTRPDSDFGPSKSSRGQQIHLVILDGTMSTLKEGCQTNAGIAYHLAQEMGAQISIYYEPGLQWDSWRTVRDVVSGRGINRQIKRAYGYLASRYRDGDKIYLMGYSRGAYAVRSLAGIIDRVGLLRRDCATERNIRQAYRLYEGMSQNGTVEAFATAHCRADVPIEMIGVWDTVKSLGINAPVLWRLSVARYAFHNHALGRHVKMGYHALARDETRVAYRPIIWESDPDRPVQIEQVWFRGSHGDVGGQLGGRHHARPLSNIPLVWMLERAEAADLPLPDGWRARFEQDARAPSIGTWAGWGPLFVTRRKRVVGGDPSERLHESIQPDPEDLARQAI